MQVTHTQKITASLVELYALLIIGYLCRLYSYLAYTNSGIHLGWRESMSDDFPLSLIFISITCFILGYYMNRGYKKAFALAILFNLYVLVFFALRSMAYYVHYTNDVYFNNHMIGLDRVVFQGIIFLGTSALILFVYQAIRILRNYPSAAESHKI